MIRGPPRTTRTATLFPYATRVRSGHAAQFLTFFTLMEPGCEIVAARKLYGGSQNQLGQSFRKMAWHPQFVDADDAGNVAAAITANTRAAFIESLANPGGAAQDIEAIAKAIGQAEGRERGGETV